MPIGSTATPASDCRSSASNHTVAEITVKTKIIKSNGETVSLDYRMRENAGSWQISDVYMDGSISQLATHRSEFHSILQREGIDGLIIALNRKVDLLTRDVAKAS